MDTSRRTRGPAADTRDRLIAGTLACLREDGIEGTTIAAVSRASGLSRPTIYAHFNSLEDLIHQAVEDATVELSSRIGKRVSGAKLPADVLVEFVVAAHREFKQDPVAVLAMEISVSPDLVHHGMISPVMMRLTREPLSRTLRDDPSACERLDEIAETLIRFLLSVLTYSSTHTRTDARLRAYLHRTMIPALGLAPTAEVGR